MIITFFNNWKSEKEFILIEISYNTDLDNSHVIITLFGIGIVFTW